MGSKRFTVETDITERMHETENLFDLVADDLRPALELMDTAGDGYEFLRAVFLDDDPDVDLSKLDIVVGPTEEMVTKVARSIVGMEQDLVVGYMALDDYNGQPVNGVGLTELEALEAMLKQLLKLRQQDAGEQADA